MEENKSFEMNDGTLEQVSGGLSDDNWADGLFRVGDEIEFMRFRPEGCKWCDAPTLAGTITGISGYAHSLRVEARCCGVVYHLDMDNLVLQ